MTQEIETKVRKQLEFYFSDANLPSDKFLLQETEKSSEGFVPLSTLMKFKRLRDICNDVEVITKAIESSDQLLLSDNRNEVRRKAPLRSEADISEEMSSRTVYAKGFPLYPEPSIEELTDFFTSNYGEVEALRLRKYHNPRKFKGSVFVTFRSKEVADLLSAKEAIVFTNGGSIEVKSRKAYDDSEYEKGSVPTEHVDWNLVLERETKQRQETSASKDDGDSKTEDNAENAADLEKLLKFTVPEDTKGFPRYTTFKEVFGIFGKVMRVTLPESPKRSFGVIEFVEGGTPLEKCLAAGSEHSVESLKLQVGKLTAEDAQAFRKDEKEAEANGKDGKRGKNSKNGKKMTSKVEPRRKSTLLGSGAAHLRMCNNNTIKFALQESLSDAALTRELRTALENEGELSVFELRRYHKVGLANFKRSFSKPMFLRKYSQQPLKTESGLEAKIYDCDEKEEKDMMERMVAMNEMRELERHVQKSDVKFPDRFNPRPRSGNSSYNGAARERKVADKQNPNKINGQNKNQNVLTKNAPPEVVAEETVIASGTMENIGEKRKLNDDSADNGNDLGEKKTKV